MAGNIFDILSWNVRGLNDKFQRALMFQYLKPLKPHIVFSQETHLDGNRILTVRLSWIQRPCSIHQVLTDPGGQYVCIFHHHFKFKYYMTCWVGWLPSCTYLLLWPGILMPFGILLWIPLALGEWRR